MGSQIAFAVTEYKPVTKMPPAQCTFASCTANVLTF